MMKEPSKTLVIGGGASGIIAAISARRRGASVVLCEKLPRLGRKILASGNGRCNLLNEDLSSTHFNEAGRPLVKSIFSRFGKTDISAFFRGIGLEIRCEEGRFFPITNQSSSVVKALEMELKRLDVGVELDFEATRLIAEKGEFIAISKKGDRLAGDKLVITCGGKTYPALGSSGSAYLFGAHFGHHVIEPVPSAVPIVVRDKLCHLLQGIRVSAIARSFLNGRLLSEASGDVIFTKYGLSGTAVLDVSREISVALNRHNKGSVWISIDLLPFMDGDSLRAELARRIGIGTAPEDMLVGLLPNKCSVAMKDIFSDPEDIDLVVAALKDRRFIVHGTRGWNEAEFTAGGIDVREIDEDTLESKLKKGVYFAGEVVDVDGRRGGYNLAWAWASGFIAGMTQ